mmetsp:Transcript_57313/g.181407  ORF Transcript_57313/g.181407 Transcript_57313/m.181407 type:complete len:107 (-) Transcript_57313:150-470(-)
MVRKRCECGRSYPSFGLSGGERKWCSKCPGRPEGAVHTMHKSKSVEAATPAPSSARPSSARRGAGAGAGAGEAPRVVTVYFEDEDVMIEGTTDDTFLEASAPHVPL